MTQPGTIQERMTDAEYFAMPGLSQSGMKDLAVSPYRYWYLHINPNRPVVEPSREMILGSAFHCAVLEPKSFSQRYAQVYQAPEDCLDTIPEIKAELAKHGIKPRSDAKKADLVLQLLEVDPGARIKEALASEYGRENAGKIFLNVDDWTRMHSAKAAILNEPEVQKILSEGEFEVSMTAKDPDTGVILKARMDWVRPDLTFDLKTFSTKRVKSIDECISDAIYYEGYHKQAYFYSMIRRLQAGANWSENKSPDFVLGFVESDEPHETRLKVLRPNTAGQMNIYWERARLEIRQMIQLYADCWARFGDKPWRTDRRIDPLIDEEMKQLAWVA